MLWAACVEAFGEPRGFAPEMTVTVKVVLSQGQHPCETTHTVELHADAWDSGEEFTRQKTDRAGGYVGTPT